MKKIGANSKWIVNTLIVLLLAAMFISDNDIVSPIIWAAWIIYWIINLYSKLKYRLGNSNYLLIPTYNDQFLRITSITLGGIVLVFSFGLIYFHSELDNYIGICIGVLVFLNGIYDVPSCRIEVKKGTLVISGVEEIGLERLKNFQIEGERLSIQLNDKSITVTNLLIDKKTSSQICEYLLRNVKIPEFNLMNTLC